MAKRNPTKHTTAKSAKVFRPHFQAEVSAGTRDTRRSRFGGIDGEDFDFALLADADVESEAGVGELVKAGREFERVLRMRLKSVHCFGRLSTSVVKSLCDAGPMIVVEEAT